MNERPMEDSHKPETGKGVLLITSGVAVFIVCSLIQGAAGSSMFSSSYRADVNAILDILVNITFYPGWIATALLVIYGLLTLVPGNKK